MQEQKPLVDIQFGLSQLGGNAELLNKMLVKFKDQFEHKAELVSNYLRDGNYDAAKMEIHTAKGITGNLGLTALYQCCKIFDAQLKQKLTDAHTLEEFTRLIDDTCAAIDTHSMGLSPKVSTSRPQRIDNAKPTLMRLLSSREFIDDEKMHSLVSSLELSESNKAQLIELIEQLQYEQAIAILNC